MLIAAARHWGTAATVAAVGLLAAGCASYGQGSAYGDHPNGYGVDFYEPFDNSRDYGPAYLVGPPNRPPLYPNDEGARSSGRTLKLLSPADSAPSIPTAQPNREPPNREPTPSPGQPPSPVE